MIRTKRTKKGEIVLRAWRNPPWESMTLDGYDCVLLPPSKNTRRIEHSEPFLKRVFFTVKEWDALADIDLLIETSSSQCEHTLHGNRCTLTAHHGSPCQFKR